MTRARASRRPHTDSRLPGTQLLAASAAHELNNIAASLRGFLELAGDGIGANAAASLRGLLEEFRIGTARIAGLGADLDALAASTATVAPVVLADCAPAVDEHAAVPVRWDCDGGISVLAAAAPARLALATLARCAGHAGGRPVALVCHVVPATVAAAAPAACAGCGATCDSGAVWFTLSQAAIRGRQPGETGPGQKCLSALELRFAALDHLAHLAGGHLLIEARPGAISLVLPLA